MRQCPRCASEITQFDKVCPRCGLPVDKMGFEEEPLNPKLTKAEKKEKKRLAKIAKKEKKREKKIRESRSDTDFSQYVEGGKNSNKEDDKSKLRRRKNKDQELKFDIDENGEFSIDTKDVELVGEETGRLIEERERQTYSVKKARGDYREPRLKWWEIYKIADRHFARRKIKKEVNKAAKIRPSFISKTKLLLLAIFLGWTGAHNFYAKNKRKGWVSVIALIFWVGVIYLGTINTFFASIQISIGGFAGFINVWIWFGDIINIIFNSFKYRIQIDGFIFNMNVATRAKLGEKYIDLELYQKPWWVRFKVWCKKKKRGYEEWKHDRRQRLIEKEKAKLAKQEEQAKIDAEIAEFEAKEDLKNEESKKVEKSKEQKIEKVKEELKETKVLEELKEIEDSQVENLETDNKPAKKSSPKKAKISINTKKKKNNKK